MVRSRQPLAERMTLVWHDWFATSNDGVGSQRLMLRQNWLFRRRALGAPKVTRTLSLLFALLAVLPLAVCAARADAVTASRPTSR
jgi:uncharacterized membrane protein